MLGKGYLQYKGRCERMNKNEECGVDHVQEMLVVGETQFDVATW